MYGSEEEACGGAGGVIVKGTDSYNTDGYVRMGTLVDTDQWGSVPAKPTKDHLVNVMSDSAGVRVV